MVVLEEENPCLINRYIWYNPKNLDPSYKMDLDFYGCFGRRKPMSYKQIYLVFQKKKKKVLSEPSGVKETSSETVSKVKKKPKKKQKKQKQHSDSENSKTNTSESGEDILDGNKVRETESEAGNVKRKKKKRKIDNKTKNGQAVKLKGFQVVDVAEELEKFEPADKSIGKKRKKSGKK